MDDPISISVSGAADTVQQVNADHVSGDIAGVVYNIGAILEDDSAWREFVIRALGELSGRITSVQAELLKQLGAHASEQLEQRTSQQQRVDELLAALRRSITSVLAAVDQRVDAIGQELDRDQDRRKARQQATDRRERLVIGLLIVLCVFGAGVLLLLLRAAL